MGKESQSPTNALPCTLLKQFKSKNNESVQKKKLISYTLHDLSGFLPSSFFSLRSFYSLNATGLNKCNRNKETSMKTSQFPDLHSALEPAAQCSFRTAAGLWLLRSNSTKWSRHKLLRPAPFKSRDWIWWTLLVLDMFMDFATKAEWQSIFPVLQHLDYISTAKHHWKKK